MAVSFGSLCPLSDGHLDAREVRCAGLRDLHPKLGQSLVPVGGWHRGGSDVGYYGVRLDIMKRALLAATVLTIACGGSTAPAPSLTLGTYTAYRPSAGTIWIASWPTGTGRSDCAQISSSITVLDGSNFSETRSYATLPGSAFFSTQQTFTGVYTSDGSGNTYTFTVDGATDIGDAQSSSADQSRDALVITRTFPLRGGCQSGGPYTIEYIK
jgi:hypothetical protein